jgi:pilus assembly protein Flp/PilA
MRSIFKLIQGFLKDEEGVTAIEYGLIAALIAVVIIVSAALVGNRLDCVFNHIANCLTDSGCGALACA